MLSRRELLQLIMSSAALTACGSDTTLNPKTVDGGSDNSDGGGEVPEPVRSDEQTLIRQFDNRRGNPGLLERGPFSRVATVGLRQDLPAPAPELPAVFTPVV